MDIRHLTSDTLRSLLSITSKKEQLIKAVADIETEIAKAVKWPITSVADAVSHSRPAKRKKTRKAKASRSKATKSGGLKERILALLHDAGNQGLKVKEIAEKLGAKPGNISVWFSTTGKKLAKKIEPGRYAVKGAKKSASSNQTVTGYLKPPASMKSEIKKAAKKAAKSKRRKSGLTPRGRAKLAANMKARWAARKAGKPAGKVGRSAKKKAKADKNPF